MPNIDICTQCVNLLLCSTVSNSKLNVVFQAQKAMKQMWRGVCWFPTQEVESCWGLCSPNNLAVWCFPFSPARTAERWCLAVRHRDTRRPSTGNTYRQSFLHAVKFLLYRTLRQYPRALKCNICSKNYVRSVNMLSRENRVFVDLMALCCLLPTVFSFTVSLG